jgi:hypothetical protein
MKTVIKMEAEDLKLTWPGEVASPTEEGDALRQRARVRRASPPEGAC